MNKVISAHVDLP